MKEFLVISDTHVPLYQSDIPKQVYEMSNEVDGIIGLGDFINLDTVLTLQTLTKRFYGVHGNMDEFDVKASLPYKKVIVIEKLTIGIIHGWGAPFDIIERIYKEFLDVEGLDIVLFGHTHKICDEIYRGIRFLNPGSATPGGSFAILEVDGSDMKFKVYRI